MCVVKLRLFSYFLVSAPAPSLFGATAAAPAFGAKPAGGGLFGSAPGEKKKKCFVAVITFLSFAILYF
jgi:hypothetical protein